MAHRTPTLALAACIIAQIGMAPTDAATDAVRETLRRAEGVVAAEDDRMRKLDGLRALARDLFDTRAMGFRTLGPELEDHPLDQQEDFFALFDEYIVRAYLQRLLFFRKPRFGFAPAVDAGDDVLVRTRIITPKDDYYIDYRMNDASGRWLATDIVIEGMSLTSNFKEQFAAVLRSRTFEELLDLMRRKTRMLKQRDLEKQEE